MQQPLSNVPGTEVTLVHVHYAPGASGAPHRHPGFTLAYILEGRVVSKVGDGPEMSYGAGELFVEEPNEAHTVSRNASATDPASLLGVLISDIGARLVEALKP